MYIEKIDLKAGIERLKELSSLDTCKIDTNIQIQRKQKEEQKKVVDFKKLEYVGNLELKNKHLKYIKCFNKDKELEYIELVEEYAKLFETAKIEKEYATKLEYLLKKIVGYNDFFKCPSIILKNDLNKIVDIIAYRPQKPDSFNSWNNPKYIYKNSHNRGDNFLFPFRREVEFICNREKYLIVGEGIKNGLNGLLYSVPFLTLESASNKINDKLLNYIKDYYDKDFNILCMFDGDKAGEKAYNNFVEQIDLDIKNFLDFDSGLDFTDYLRKELI